MHVSNIFSLAGLLLTAGLTSALELDLDSEESIISAGRTIVEHIFTIYKGNETGGIPGILPRPYYWWEAGLMFDSLVNYWAVSGDSDLTEVIGQALAFQVGPGNDYITPNQSRSIGNDDQSSWANAALTAAEVGFPQPADLGVTWVELAENVFNSQVLRWNTESCGGGLKWQLFTFNQGYNYKNSVSTLSFATLGARLSRFTGNTTYSDWAQQSIDWLQNVGLITSASDSDRVAIYDGTEDLANCTEINHIEWTQNAGLFLSTSAYASNATGAPTSIWDQYSTAGITYANTTFASPQFDRSGTIAQAGIINEVACIPSGTCNVDQRAMRTSLARGLSRTRDLIPNGNLTATLNDILRASAQAAAAQCTGGESGTVCGLDWTAAEYDGSEGIGEDLAALEVILANLPQRRYAVANASSETDGAVRGNGTSRPRNGTEVVGDENAGSMAGVSIWGLSAALLGAMAMFA